MEIIVDLVMWPLYGICAALAGILWPSDDPGVRRLQRFALALVVVGTAALATAVVLAYFANYRLFFAFLAAAFICLVIGGVVGERIEKRCKANRERTQTGG